MAQLSALDWIMAAAQRLGTHGVDQVRVEPLATELGVSKGSFYWHFHNRAALLDALLETWESAGTEQIIAAVNAKSDDPRERLKALTYIVFGSPDNDGFEVQVRSWASHDANAATVVERVDGRREGYIAELAEAAGATPELARTKAKVAYRTLLGEFLMRNTGTAGLTPEELEYVAEWFADVGA